MAKTPVLDQAYELLRSNPGEAFDAYSQPEGLTQQTFNRLIQELEDYPGVEFEKRVPSDGSSNRRRLHVWYSEQKQIADNRPKYQICYVKVLGIDGETKTLVFSGPAQCDSNEQWTIEGVSLTEPLPLPDGYTVGKLTE